MNIAMEEAVPITAMNSSAIHCCISFIPTKMTISPQHAFTVSNILIFSGVKQYGNPSRKKDSMTEIPSLAIMMKKNAKIDVMYLNLVEVVDSGSSLV